MRSKGADGARHSVTVTNVRVFDGESVVDADSVSICGGLISAVGGQPPADSEVIDGHRATLLPGLIDSHSHPTMQGLEQAVRFGVTTVLEMGGAPRSPESRAEIAADDRLADIRSAGAPLTAPCGHPNELLVDPAELFTPDGGCRPEAQRVRGLAEPADVTRFVARRVQEGSDFIKVLAEEGSVLASPGLPQLGEEVFAAAVREAHRHGKLVVAHALTYEATLEMLRVGADGLTHIFVDRPPTEQIVSAIVEAGVFVIPCLVLNRTITGSSGAEFASDPRVSSRLDAAALRALSGSFNTWPDGDFGWSVRTVAALHKAGVAILAGTDAAAPEDKYGGLAQGASLHQELELLVQAGLTPTEALRAATSVPAKAFGLSDRGRLSVGARADLLLVEGDPTTDVTATLNTRAVWRNGTMSTPTTTP